MNRVANLLGCFGLATVVCVAGGCSKKSSPKTTPAVETAPPAAQSDQLPNKEEVAQGDLRDALLALQRVHFPLDSFELTEEARNALTLAAEKLNKYPQVELHVEGNADERGTDEYNVAIGEKRAKAVNDYLTKLGVAAARLHVVSYGESRPIASGEAPDALAQNRRVDFTLVKGDVRLVLEAGKMVDDQGNPIGPAPAPAPK